jgi:DDE superfamily endonuclease
LAARIADSPKYTPYFDDCLGALDGTHIAAYVPTSQQARYRNRKGTLSQNVLAVCDFNMRFTYILSGWEGSAHDGRVLQDAQGSYGFNTPKGMYWLGDAGYGNSEYVMAPYRGVRYHLKEQRLAAKKPETAHELFNLRHASLRNVIERIFGVIKRKFRILAQAAEYSTATQADLVLAICGLYNFIQEHEDITQELDSVEVDEDEGTIDRGVQQVEAPTQGRKNKYMEDKREAIAQQMWKDYQQYINSNPTS